MRMHLMVLYAGTVIRESKNMKSIRQLRDENPIRLTIYLCDRCHRTVNRNEEADHAHPERCDNCVRCCQLDGAWGCCTSSSSVYGGRVVFGGDTCAAWEPGPAKPEVVGVPCQLSRYRAHAEPPLKPEQGAARNIDELNGMRPLSGDLWCDRCEESFDKNRDLDHLHSEQCGGCQKYRELDSDWGYCASHASIYGGRKVGEHDTCTQWKKGTWR